MALRLLLVEDERLWQQGITQLVALEPSIEVVGVADNYEEALEQYAKLQPDMVLLDWNLPGDYDGIDAGAWMIQQGHDPEKLLLVSGASLDSIPEIPYGHVPKSQMATLLLPALQQRISF